jgi:hypothetical protein
MAHACYPSIWEAEIRKSSVWDQLWQIVHCRPHLQNNQTKVDWKHGLCSTAPALQA